MSEEVKGLGQAGDLSSELREAAQVVKGPDPEAMEELEKLALAGIAAGRGFDNC
jgi:hypothetical protein